MGEEGQSVPRLKTKDLEGQISLSETPGPAGFFAICARRFPVGPEVQRVSLFTSLCLTKEKFHRLALRLLALQQGYRVLLIDGTCATNMHKSSISGDHEKNNRTRTRCGVWIVCGEADPVGSAPHPGEIDIASTRLPSRKHSHCCQGGGASS
jgi:hypothetical protein